MLSKAEVMEIPGPSFLFSSGLTDDGAVDVIIIMTAEGLMILISVIIVNYDYHLIYIYIFMKFLFENLNFFMMTCIERMNN